MIERNNNDIAKRDEIFDLLQKDENYLIKEFFLKDENKKYINIEIKGNPLILTAAFNKNWELVMFLYDEMANIDVQSNLTKKSLIGEAIEHGPENLVRGLIEYGEINFQDRDGKTPLMKAIELNKTFAINALIESQKCNYNLTDNEKNNAIHYLIKNKDYKNSLEVIKKNIFLLDIKNGEGNSAFDIIENLEFKESLLKNLKNIESINKQIIENENTLKNELIDTNKKEESKIGLSKIKRK